MLSRRLVETWPVVRRLHPRGFRPEERTIRVEHNGDVLTVPLRAAQVKEGRATLRGTVQLFQDQIAGVQATLFPGEETFFPLKDGVTLRLLAERRPDGTILYRTDGKFSPSRGFGSKGGETRQA